MVAKSIITASKMCIEAPKTPDTSTDPVATSYHDLHMVIGAQMVLASKNPRQETCSRIVPTPGLGHTKCSNRPRTEANTKMWAISLNAVTATVVIGILLLQINILATGLVIWVVKCKIICCFYDFTKVHHRYSCCNQVSGITFLFRYFNPSTSFS